MHPVILIREHLRHRLSCVPARSISKICDLDTHRVRTVPREQIQANHIEEHRCKVQAGSPINGQIGTEEGEMASIRRQRFDELFEDRNAYVGKIPHCTAELLKMKIIRGLHGWRAPKSDSWREGRDVSVEEDE